MTRVLSIILLIVLAGQSFAQTTSTRGRTVLFESQLKILDNRAKQQYNTSVRLKPTSVVIPSGVGSVPAYNGTYRGPYLVVAQRAARKHRIPVDLFLRLVNQESRWNANAKSHKGALGLAQLMPGTARQLGVNPKVPAENLEGGARYLAQQYREFGSWSLALAAYNAGPGAVRKYGRIPPFKETQNYVKIIMGR